jgi:hypothetical protein
MKNIVIYHSADFDGIFCREIARLHFGPDAIYLGWDYGQPLPGVTPDVERIYMLDISVDGLMGDPRLTWIDHHKSAIDKYPATIRGYRIDGVAACRLAWQWFFRDTPGDIAGESMPDKREYFEHVVAEPLAVRLAGEYDVWDRRDPNAELFQHGLRSCDLDALWPLILNDRAKSNIIVQGLLDAGKMLQYVKTNENANIASHFAFDIEFEGLKFCAINHARYNSHLFDAAIRPDHDGCFGFNWTGKEWRVSLYHSPHKTNIDLSVIAVKYGGGGHRGACGFRCAKLPFIP